MEPDSSHEHSPLSSYLRVLRRRKWIVLACAIVVPLTAYVLSARQPAQYRASAEVYLSSQDIAGALTGISAGYVDEVRLADTQASLAHVPAVAHKAIDLAGVDGITAGGLLGSTSIAPQGGTNILTFSVVNGDPKHAARLATAYANAFTTYRGELDTEALRRARDEVQARLAELQAGGEGKSKLATSLRDKEQQLATLEALQTSRTYVIRQADGAYKFAPTPRRNAMAGLFLGLVLGLGLAFGLEALDTRVRSAHEIGERLGITQLARLPRPPKDLAKSDRLAMIEQPAGTNAEAFRMLRTNLDFVRLDSEEVRTLLVTSAVEQEGKSTTAANLAVAEARAGRRVVLVDLDLRRPYVGRFFGLQDVPGVTDVALGRATLGTALMRVDLATGDAAPTGWIGEGDQGEPTERHALDVIAAGPLPPDPGEFVGTLKLGEILERLRAVYDLVIIDTPPALRVGDAMTLSRRADGIVIVTRLNLVRRPMLNELRRLLGTTKIPKLGFVVTGARDGRGDDYGYATYGYDYGAGRPKEKKRKPRPERPTASPLPQEEPEDAGKRGEEQPAPRAEHATSAAPAAATVATERAPAEPSRRERRAAEKAAKRAAEQAAKAEREAAAVRERERREAEQRAAEDEAAREKAAEKAAATEAAARAAAQAPAAPAADSGGSVESALDRIARIMEEAGKR